jgi:hypothetical protein
MCGHGGIDVLIGRSILAYGQYGLSRARMVEIRPFLCICGMVVACNNLTSLSILVYGWHGGVDKSVNFVVWVVRWQRRRKISVNQFWRMGVHGGNDVLNGPTMLAY